MRFQDITFTIDIDSLSQEQYDERMAKLQKLFTVVGEVNTMTYDDELMESLGYSSPDDFTAWEEAWEGSVYLPMSQQQKEVTQ